MEATNKESVSETSSCDVEAQDPQSLTDYKDDELFKDRLTKNTSEASSSTADARSDLSSDHTLNSSSDIQSTADKLDHQLISGDGATTGEAINTEVPNPLNALAVCPLPTSSVHVIKTSMKPVLENFIHSNKEKKLDTLNISDIVEDVKTLNTGTEKAKTSKEMVDFSVHTKKRLVDSNNSERTLDKSGARAKFQSPHKATSVSVVNSEQENKSCPSSKTNFRPQQRNTRNISYSPSALVRNSSRTCTRFRYSETRKKFSSTKKGSIHSNQTAKYFNRSSSVALKSQNNHQSNNKTVKEQSESSSEISVSSRSSTDCSNLKENDSFSFNPDAETLEAAANQTCEISGKSQKEGLLELKEDGYPENDAEINLLNRHIRLSIKKVESWDCVPLETKSPDRSSRYKDSCTHSSRLSETPFPQNVDRWNSNLTDSRRPRCLSLDDKNIALSSISTDYNRLPSIQSSTFPQTCTDPVVLSGSINFTADFTVENSGSVCSASSNGPVRISDDIKVENNDASLSSDYPVSNKAACDSTTNPPVLNYATHQSFHEPSVLNNSIADTSSENQTLNNVVPHTLPDNPVFIIATRTYPGRLTLNIVISHTFSQHPALNYVLFQNSFDCPSVNTTLSHLFSDLPALNVPHSHLLLNNPIPTLFDTFPRHAHRPVLHISLSSYPEHLSLLGFSHNSSENPVLNITLFDYFSGHRIFYSSFNHISAPRIYPGQPVLTNDPAYNLSERRVLINAIPDNPRGQDLNNTLPKTANPENAICNDSNVEPLPSIQNHSAQPIVHQFFPPAYSYQPLAHSSNDFTNGLGANVIQQHPSQPFYNPPAYGIERNRLPMPRDFFGQYYDPQIHLEDLGQIMENQFQRLQMEFGADSDTDQDEYTDTDQGIYTDTDQEEQADQ